MGQTGDEAFRRAAEAIADAPSRRDLHAALDRLGLSADAKALLRNLAGLTVTVGGTILAVGRKIVGFVLTLAKAFPNTLFGVVVAVVVTMLIASVPLVGGLLAPVAGPLLIAFGLTKGALSDARDGALRARVSDLEALFRDLAPAT